MAPQSSARSSRGTTRLCGSFTARNSTTSAIRWKACSRLAMTGVGCAAASSIGAVARAGGVLVEAAPTSRRAAPIRRPGRSRKAVLMRPATSSSAWRKAPKPGASPPRFLSSSAFEGRQLRHSRPPPRCGPRATRHRASRPDGTRNSPASPLPRPQPARLPWGRGFGLCPVAGRGHDQPRSRVASSGPLVTGSSRTTTARRSLSHRNGAVRAEASSGSSAGCRSVQ